MLNLFNEYNPFKTFNNWTKLPPDDPLINESTSLLDAERSLYSNFTYDSTKFGKLRITDENEYITFSSDISHPLQLQTSSSSVKSYGNMTPYITNNNFASSNFEYSSSCFTSMNDVFCSAPSQISSICDSVHHSVLYPDDHGDLSSGDEYVTACNSLQFELSTTLIDDGSDSSPYLTFAYNDIRTLQLAHDYNDYFTDNKKFSLYDNKRNSSSDNNGSISCVFKRSCTDDDGGFNSSDDKQRCSSNDKQSCSSNVKQSCSSDDKQSCSSNDKQTCSSNDKQSCSSDDKQSSAKKFSSSTSTASGKVEIVQKYEEVNRGSITSKYNMYIHGIQPYWKLVLTDSVIFRKGKQKSGTPMGDVSGHRTKEVDMKDYSEFLDTTLKAEPDTADECSENDVPSNNLLQSTSDGYVTTRGSMQLLSHAILVDERMIDHDSGCLACVLL